jgi:hypothetical protein
LKTENHLSLERKNGERTNSLDGGETDWSGGYKSLEATMGFEPMIRVLQTLALASWPRRLAELILSDGHMMVKRENSSAKIP